MVVLADPRIHYQTLRDAIITNMQANKTWLNEGLTSLANGGGTFTRDSQIIAGDPETKPIPSNLYPVIMIRIASKTENWIAVGNAGRKRPVITFQHYGIIQKMDETYDNEIMNLADNIESLYRKNINLTNATLYTTPNFTDFGLGALGRGVYCQVCRVDIECTVEVK